MSGAPLRVAHVVATSGRSGVESHLRALLPCFDPAAVHARLFVPGPGPLVDALAAHGFAAEPGAPTSKWAWGEARALAARLRGSCDILHAHGPRAAFWAAQVTRWARIPRFVCTVHELRWLSLPAGPRRAAWLAFEAWAFRRADALVVLSPDAEARVRERWPELAPRLTLIPGTTPLLLGNVPGAPVESRDRTGPLRVVSIGQFVDVKRFHLLLDAVALVARRSVTVELTLAGHGALERALRERARSLGIESLVHWPGGVFDVTGLLAAADVFVSTSNTETFGIAALEAMAIGLPVVTADNGGVSALVVDGATGRVVRAGDDDGLAAGIAEALAGLAADPARRLEWGQASRHRARTVYPPAAMAEATTALYQRLWGSRREDR